MKFNFFIKQLMEQTATNNVDVEALKSIETGTSKDPSNEESTSGARGAFQMKRAAWNEGVRHLGKELEWPYHEYVNDDNIATKVADAYVNGVIPQRYFRTNNIPDDANLRVAAYTEGPVAISNLYKKFGDKWLDNATNRVKWYINHYNILTNSPSLTQNPNEYIIRPGDTPEKIANSFKIKLSDLYTANPKMVATRLTVGSSIKIPTTSLNVQQPSEYTIKPGDSLSKISLQFKKPIKEILKLNPQIKNPNVIKPGDKIKI